MKSVSRSLAPILLGALVLVVAGCNRNVQLDPAVLARVGDRAFRQEDLQRELQWRIENKRPVPSMRALLDEMVAQEILVQRARAAGLEQDPDYQRACRLLLASNLKERELKPKLASVEVSEAEVRAEYEKHRSDYATPAKVRMALIHIALKNPSPEKRSELMARMNEARDKALALAPGTTGFGPVALDFSEDQGSRFKGGDVGWYDLGQNGYRWPAQVISAAFALDRNGAVSEVIETSDDLFLVMKLDSRVASYAPLAQVEPGLRRRLLAEKKQSVENDFKTAAQQGLKIAFFPEAIASLPAAASKLAQQNSEPPGMP